MSKSSELLFGFLCDIAYNADNASLCLNEIDDEHQTLGQGLIQLQCMLKEQRNFALALSKGNLSIAPPSSENELAAPLKSLQASLRHLSWQSQQVALGDYHQIVNFMGEFSEAFNTMTQQLDKRQKALEQEVESGRAKTEALEQSNEVLTHITLNSAQKVIVIDDDSGAVVYTNKSADITLRVIPDFLGAVMGIARDEDAVSGGEIVISLPYDEKTRYFAVTVYRLLWNGRSACTLVAQDITLERENLARLEFYANKDEMTGVNNRHAGLEILNRLIEEKKHFVLCFFDIDNLKYVNDTFGHHEGDSYIMDSAGMISGAFAHGIPCRLGGDEFMLLLPDVDLDKAQRRIAELCEEFHICDKAYQRRISYGCVEVTKQNDRTAKQLLSQADNRMYELKRRHKALRAD
jgi:diguanylate cyclase (GGDEF)-like protein